LFPLLYVQHTVDETTRDIRKQKETSQDDSFSTAIGREIAQCLTSPGMRIRIKKIAFPRTNLAPPLSIQSME
jgi:hypothetical protein